MKSTLPACLTIREVAAYLRIGETKVRKLIRLKKLAAVDIGKATGRGQLRITQKALDDFQQSLLVSALTPKPRQKKEKPPHPKDAKYLS